MTRDHEDDDLRSMYEYVHDEGNGEDKDHPYDVDEDGDEGPSVSMDWEWTLTNIGAIMSISGLIISVSIFAMMMLTGYMMIFFAIPPLILILIGYALIVKDHFDIRKKTRRKKRTGPERNERKEETSGRKAGRKGHGRRAPGRKGHGRRGHGRRAPGRKTLGRRGQSVERTLR